MKWYKIGNRIEVVDIGKIITRNYHPTRILPYSVLGFVLSGSRTISVLDEILYLSPGDTFFLPANIEHRGVKNDPHSIIYFHFYSSFTQLRKLPEMLSDTIHLPMKGIVPKDIDCIDILEGISKDFVTYGPTFEEYFATQMKSILQRVSLFNQKRLLEGHSLSYRILDFVVGNLGKQICAKDIESHFSASYTKLNASFKSTFSMTIRQKLIDLRIQKAHQLLLNGESTLATAFKCGFNDYYYFLKCFKRLRGYTPKQVRKVHREPERGVLSEHSIKPALQARANRELSEIRNGHGITVAHG